MSSTVSGTKEWSSSSANVMEGCSNDCAYCYAKAQAIRFKRQAPATWAYETHRPKNFGRRKGTVMFPTTHDITATNFVYCQRALIDLLNAGNRVLVVTKPDPAVIMPMCASLASSCRDLQVLFRFTIGSMDPYTLKLWEPNAPCFAERLYALVWAYSNGWATSVSIEPMLDRERRDVVRLVDTVAPYVTDTIWLGKLNKGAARLSVNFGGRVPPDLAMALGALQDAQADGHIKALYESIKGHPKVRWKESIKKIVGIELATEAGLDQ